MKKNRNWIFSVVVGILCIILGFVPDATNSASAALPRERVRILSVNNSELMPMGIVYTGAQTCRVLIKSGPFTGYEVDAINYMNSALDKDKLFEVGDTALAMVSALASGACNVTLIDHYRLHIEGGIFALFGLFLILFGGITGFGALISLVASVMIVWKVLIPLLLRGISPLWASLLTVMLLTAIIMFLIAGFKKQAFAALIGSLLGTLLTCCLAFLFGNVLKLDGGSLPYIVPLLAQSSMKLNIRELFFSMVFIANSGALMDLAMDISSACHEICLHKPTITRSELLKSGFSVGKNVIGTMTTTLMLAYSGSYLSMMLYFAGQGIPVIDIFNLKFVASEILITLVGSFGLVTVAPFTAIVASMLMVENKSEKVGIEI